ncbi:MAG: putative lipoprotein [Mycobacterium sp.]|jgi:hypothetical protein|nr:putative lipoprotein [Mycobacterium sp.]
MRGAHRRPHDLPRAADATGAEPGVPGRSRTWLVVAAALLVGALTCVTVGLQDTGRPLPGPQALAAPGVPPADAAVGMPGRPRSVPVALHIAAIGLSVPLGRLGLNPDGTAQVPRDYQRPGWFEPGPSPGQTGSAVLLGHVDSYQGPAVFFKLRLLAPGDVVDVTLADGGVLHFRVTAVASYAKDQFPSQQVYGSHGYSALQLVTCGGVFDARTRNYLSNVVAYSSLVA